ncbi:transporter protein [Caballeronia arationis]|jgi:MFS family permease|uniref:Predicted arabinose efflux permease, MFS family n=1 Tax=Caballeronia arationis TaxID=1777142 RepID=A0A7Z7I5J7_9BURK|nr:MFS transporter [Caballeronia arationis]SAL00901.1 transporter protein [Caballeronia arationis]SOE63971.1 Predicted arabinose efflux permease, MFS family [Caballeronia arationis]
METPTLTRLTDASAPSPAPLTRKQSRTRLVTAAAVGNALEFYDFTVYGFFALLIGKLFFPVHDPVGQLLLAVASFGVGFFTRPVGGLLIGMYADRAGRKKAMVLTLALMAVGTAMIAFAPTYAQVGIAAPVILVVARLIQGFSAGGEVGASTTLLLEQAPANRRGLYASWQFASQGLAAMAGALTGVCLTSALSPAQLESWGWRVPFVIGTLIVPVGWWLRKTLDEEPPAAHAAEKGKAPKVPLIDVLRDHRRAVLTGLGLTIGGTAAHFIIVFYLSIYGVKMLGLPAWTAMLSGCVSGAILFVLAPVGGYLSDRFGRKRMAQMTRVLLMLAIYPAFVALNRWPSATTLLATVTVLSCVHGINIGGVGAMLGELFPRSVRATGAAVVYSLGVAIFGGFAQFFVTSLIVLTGSTLAPAWYVIACGALSLVGVAYMRESAGTALD